jgi:hypothetical protein
MQHDADDDADNDADDDLNGALAMMVRVTVIHLFHADAEASCHDCAV